MKVHDYLDFHALRRPDAALAVCDERQISCGEARDKADRVARAFAEYGLTHGDRIVVVARNSIEVLLLYQGALKAGVVPTPISHRLMPSDWLRLSNDAGAKLFFCDAQSAAHVETIRDQCETVSTFIVTQGQPPTRWATMDEWLEWPAGSTDASVSIGEDDTAFQMHTSGTTGQPRPATLTHRAVTANVAQLGIVAPLRVDDRFLLVLPLMHAAGLITMLHAVSSGACLVIHRGFKPIDVLGALDEGGVTVTMMVPTMIRACLDEGQSMTHRAFKNLRLVIYGASAIDEDTLRQAMGFFGCDFAQRYGTTETLSLTWLSPSDHRKALQSRPELLQSAGRPLPGTEIRVIDERGRRSSAKIGELVARGPQLMPVSPQGGVFNDVDSVDEWIRTGDIGSIDQDGYVYISDRVKDVIVSGGENIHPREIEDALMRHHDVGEAAVIGVPDKKWGEAVKAIVVLRGVDGNSAKGELIDHCRQHLAGFKVPKTVEFVSRLPRDSAGKVLRRQLREPYWRDHERPL